MFLIKLEILSLAKKKFHNSPEKMQYNSLILLQIYN